MAIACDKCGRSDVYATKALLAAGGDELLTNLRTTLTADCPRVQRAEVSDWCGARFKVGEAPASNVTSMVRKPD